MPVKFGNSSISSIRFGTTEIIKAYRGTELVYQKSGRVLPDDYYEVEYIESTGTQRINTGLTVMTGATWYSELDMLFTVAQSTSQVALASSTAQGSWFGQNSSQYAISSGTDGRFTNVEPTTRQNISSNWGVAPRTTIGDLTRFFLDTVKTNYGQITLFASPNDNYPFYSFMRLYSAKIYNADHKILRDFVPVVRKADAKAGLWDYVSGAFFTAENGGDFVAPRIVPDWYTSVVYIQSSGTQYIDTGVKANQDTKLAMKLAFLNRINEESPFGAYESNSKFLWNFSGYDYSYPMFGTSQNNITHNLSVNTQYAIEIGKNGAYLDGAKVKDFGSQTFQMTGTVNLFRRNPISGTTLPRLATINLYECQMYQNEFISHDYAPAVRKSDNTVGLYDKLTNTFLVNQGTGVFVAG